MNDVTTWSTFHPACALVLPSCHRQRLERFGTLFSSSTSRGAELGVF